MTEATRFPYGMNQAFTSGVFAAQTGTATMDSTTAVQACVNGIFVTALAALTNQVFVPVSADDGSTTIVFTSLAANQACNFISCVNSAGAIKHLQGPIIDLETDGTFKTALGFGPIPDTLTPIAIHKVVCGSTSSGFIPGTTFWDATGVTTTVYNISMLPKRPFTS